MLNEKHWKSTFGYVRVIAETIQMERSEKGTICDLLLTEKMRANRIREKKKVMVQ